MKQSTSAMSILSLILGILSLILCCVGFGGILGIAGFILGLIVLITKKPGKGLAIAGIITSIIGMILSLMIVAGLVSNPMNTSSSNTKKISETTAAQVRETTKGTPESSAEVTETTAPPIEYTKYSADELLNDLKANALKAKDKYDKQYVELTGKLSNIDSDGKYISLVPTGDEFTFIGIQCYIKNEDQKKKVMEMSIDDTVTLKGKIKSVGEVMGYSLDIDEIE